MPAFQPYWGKPAVRNERGDRGDVGIIRSPVRASIPPASLYTLLILGLISASAAAAQAQSLDMGNADLLYRRCQSALSISVTPDMYQRGLDTGLCSGTVWTVWSALLRARPMWDWIDHLPKLPDPPKNATEQQRQAVGTEALKRVMLISGLDRVASSACIAENVNLHTMIMVVVKYGQDHPDKLAKNAYDFVGEALSETFKCPAAPK